MKKLSLALAAIMLLLLFASCGGPSNLTAATLRKLADKKGYVYYSHDNSSDYILALKFDINANTAFRVDLKNGNIKESDSAVFDFRLVDDDTINSEFFRVDRARKIYVSEKNDFIIFTEQDDPDSIRDALVFYNERIKNNIVTWYNGDREPIWDDSLDPFDELIAQYEAFSNMSDGSAKKTTVQTTAAQEQEPETTAATLPILTEPTSALLPSTVAPTQPETILLTDPTIPTTAPPITSAPANPYVPEGDSYNVGNSIFFGKYDQNNNPSDAEPIEWIVLRKEGMQYLVISKYALDCMQYNSRAGDTTWETCSLRAWLNGSFFRSAFAPEEQPRVLVSELPSQDRVFCLSSAEVRTYLPQAGQRMALATQSAVQRGAYTENGFAGWWLRDAGDTAATAARVNIHGQIKTSESTEGGVERRDFAVRPAMWIYMG